MSAIWSPKKIDCRLSRPAPRPCFGHGSDCSGPPLAAKSCSPRSAADEDAPKRSSVEIIAFPESASTAAAVAACAVTSIARRISGAGSGYPRSTAAAAAVAATSPTRVRLREARERGEVSTAAAQRDTHAASKSISRQVVNSSQDSIVPTRTKETEKENRTRKSPLTPNRRSFPLGTTMKVQDLQRGGLHYSGTNPWVRSSGCPEIRSADGDAADEAVMTLAMPMAATTTGAPKTTDPRQERQTCELR